MPTQLPNIQNIHPLPWWLKLLPAFSKTAATFNKKIYLPDWQYQEIISNKLSAQTHGTLLHESVHVQNQTKLGFISYALRYLFSKNFRLKEELVAHHAQFVFLKAQRVQFDMSTRAKEFSSITYLWCTSEHRAQKLLQDLWVNS